MHRLKNKNESVKAVINIFVFMCIHRVVNHLEISWKTFYINKQCDLFWPHSDLLLIQMSHIIYLQHHTFKANLIFVIVSNAAKWAQTTSLSPFAWSTVNSECVSSDEYMTKCIIDAEYRLVYNLYRSRVHLGKHAGSNLSSCLCLPTRNNPDIYHLGCSHRNSSVFNRSGHWNNVTSESS